jgi:hypothetical protein
MYAVRLDAVKPGIKGKRFRHGSKDQGRKFCGIGCLSLEKDGFFEQPDRTALQARAS